MARHRLRRPVPPGSSFPDNGAHRLRLAYLGTPALAVPPLLALLAAGHEIPIVVSGADKRRGRGRDLQPTPVKAAALEAGLTVTDDVDDLLDYELDLAVVVAYGRLVRPHVLDHVDMVNLHFSLLPRWRGAAPVERAILAGDRETGVCVMALEEGLDTGGVYRRHVEPIRDDDTLDSLRSRLVESGVELLVEALAGGTASLGDPEPQVGEVTYAAKIDPDELHLDLADPAIHIDRVIRLGRAWTTVGDRRLRVWRAAVIDDRHDLGPGELDLDHGDVVVGCGQGALRLLEVQPEGKPRMAAGAWRNGAGLATGDHLG